MFVKKSFETNHTLRLPSRTFKYDETDHFIHKKTYNIQCLESQSFK